MDTPPSHGRDSTGNLWCFFLFDLPKLDFACASTTKQPASCLSLVKAATWHSLVASPMWHSLDGDSSSIICFFACVSTVSLGTLPRTVDQQPLFGSLD